jgi:probable rRNA maturation factor
MAPRTTPGAMDDGPSPTSLTIAAPGWRAALPDPAALCARAVAAALARALPGGREAEVSILLADDATLRKLNRRWRGRDRPTNVLSFPALDLAPGEPPPPGATHLGDLALALETVLSEARDEGKAPADHLAHLVVHGTLHLLGHDHGDDAAAEVMEQLERRILADLGIGDPYRDPAEAEVMEST